MRSATNRTPTRAAVAATPPPDVRDEPSLAVLHLFAASWAVVSVLHLWGNVGPVARFPTLTAPRLGQGLVAAAAVAVLRRPSDLRRLVALAAIGLWTVWLEAPMLSNHWLVAGFVDLVILIAAATTVMRHRRLDGPPFWAGAAPAIRLVVVVFYAFAGFAKLNRDFLDPAVSCASFFSSETARSLGLGAVTDAGGRALATAVIAATVAVELSIPVLLVVRRTRSAGVVLALVFHFVLALDQTHQFVDFSGLLSALVLLFLPAAFAPWVLHRLASRSPLVMRAAAGAGGVVLVAAFLPGQPGLAVGRSVLWSLMSVGLIVAVVTWLRRERPAAEAGAFAVRSRWMLLLPALVVVNGLTPYLELKTAFAFTMYSNLRVERGRSNHLVVRRTLPLTSIADDPVRIIGSSDAGLRRYGTEGFGITWHQLRAFASDHPSVALRYERRGVIYDLGRASDDPALVAPVDVVSRKVVVFRSVDLRSWERCQPNFDVAG